MTTMDDYPSIAREPSDMDIYAFDKLDGSLIRAEWHPIKGFWKFGTRTRLTHEDEPVFGEAVHLINKGFSASIGEMFRSEGYRKALAYFEFWGPHSFAGNHENEPHQVTLFDVRVHKKGILPPNEFMRLTRKYDVPRVDLLYHGKPNEPFLELVRSGKLPGMTFEGVVCKATRLKSPGIPWMFKVKNRAWIERLRGFCGNDEAKFNELL